MLTVEEALERVLAQVPKLGQERVLVADARGRILARDIASEVSLPPWDNSAMDGYAVRADDVSGEQTKLRLMPMVAAGSELRMTVEPGAAVPIMTGAPVPDGADAVVIVENTDGAQSGEVTIRGPARVGQNIRFCGEAVEQGSVVLRAGRTMSPGALGMCHAVGVTHVDVVVRPTVAVLSTGDELVEPGQPLGPGQIWSSNDVALCALVHEAGGLPVAMPTVRDDLAATVDALRTAVENADLVVTTGGVSVGEHDYVKEAFRSLGAGMAFWKVRMKPGKPLAYGVVRQGERAVPVFGLPGNPVSCMVNFLQFVRPVMGKALGRPRPFLPVVEAVAGEDFTDNSPRARLLRVVLAQGEHGLVAHSTGLQSSGALLSMAIAHGLLLVGEEQPPPKAGELVRVQVFDGSFFASETPNYGWS